jgi:glutamate-ammonia-ligase adenylyltransferase
LTEGPRAGQASRYVLLGLGKLGGRELSYQSDLDLLLVYEGDGRTGRPPEASRFDQFEITDNLHYFTELAQRIIKATSLLGPKGRLYQVDMRLRPTGKSGSLVIPLAEFRRYYADGGAQIWERQLLTRGRVVYGDAAFAAVVMEEVHRGAYGWPWSPRVAEEILVMREKLEESRGERDLKRGFGGIVDVEFLVQLFQMKYGHNLLDLRSTNTWDGLDNLEAHGLLSKAEYTVLRSGYDFLRQVESRLRIVHNRSLDELPDDAENLDKLARRAGFETFLGTNPGTQLVSELDRTMTYIRELFLKLVQREMKP